MPSRNLNTGLMGANGAIPDEHRIVAIRVVLKTVFCVTTALVVSETFPNVEA